MIDILAERVAAEQGIAHRRVVDALSRSFDAVFRAVADGGDAWVHGLGHLRLEVGPPATIYFDPEPPVAAELGVRAAEHPSHRVAQLPGNLTAATGRTGGAITALVEGAIHELRRTLLSGAEVPWPSVGVLRRQDGGYVAHLTPERQTELEGAQACQWADLKVRLGAD